MPMDRSEYRRRVLGKVLKAPSVIVPALLSVGALFFAGMFEMSPTLGIAAVCGLAWSAVAAGFRWFRRSDDLMREAHEQLVEESQKTHKKYLRHLRRDLNWDYDFRTSDCLKQLKKINDRLHRAGILGKTTRADRMPEIREQAETLYRHCLDSLERTLELWKAAQEMSTDQAKQELLDSREQLIGEVQTSIEHLRATLDHLQSAQLKRDPKDEDLSRVREELAQGIEVARRVEQRVEELDRGLRHEKGDSPPSAF